jgi:hypothetical protein
VGRCRGGPAHDQALALGVEIATRLAAKPALYRRLQKRTLNQRLPRRIVEGVRYGVAPEGLTAADLAYQGSLRPRHVHAATAGHAALTGPVDHRWRQSGVLISAAVKRRRHEVTIDSLIRLQVLLDELRRLGKSRELRDYVWWSAQDAADYADGKLAEALRQLRAGELGDEYVPSAEDLDWARRELDDPGARGKRS